MAAGDLDWLVLGGRRRMLFADPLHRYLWNLPTRPDFRLPVSTSNRGYIATWELRDDLFYLSDLQTCPPNQGPDPGVRLLFRDAREPVHATWVRERLRSANGEQVRFELFADKPVYARETRLLVWDGKLLVAEEFDGRTDRRLSHEVTSHLEAFVGPEEGAFIRAAVDTPEDSAPRLIYADWLDERGDPRGTMIRIAERARHLTSEEKLREYSFHMDLLRHHGLKNGLWSTLMGYKNLTNIVSL
jgi:uncharacterized protein (TIGR02996 family)